MTDEVIHGLKQAVLYLENDMDRNAKLRIEAEIGRLEETRN